MPASTLAIDTGGAEIALTTGRLRLRWSVLPERRVALLRLPRLEVRFAFDRASPDTRADFMRRLDLHTQRGGG